MMGFFEDYDGYEMAGLFAVVSLKIKDQKIHNKGGYYREPLFSDIECESYFFKSRPLYLLSMRFLLHIYESNNILFQSTFQSTSIAVAFCIRTLGYEDN